jgi:hypothetical protein
MRGQKRAATELLPTHREPKHARLMPENSAPNQAEGVIHNTLSSRWWQIGTELVNLMADTVVLVFGMCWLRRTRCSFQTGMIRFSPKNSTNRAKQQWSKFPDHFQRDSALSTGESYCYGTPSSPASSTQTLAYHSI